MSSCNGRVVVGVGISTRATRDEVADLVRSTLAHHCVQSAAVTIATRAVFAEDERLQLGCLVIGIEDDELIAHSRPVDRSIGIPARVAETAARLAAGPNGRLLGRTHRSSHATAAVAVLGDLATVAGIAAGTAASTAEPSPTVLDVTAVAS